ncbi:Glutamate 5-kinase [Trebouxia sp. C0010 RCD-2024]
MSWQAYVDDHLMVPLPHGGQLVHAAIVGQDGGVWAQDANFPAITVEETLALVKGCNDTTGGYGGLGQTGLMLGGIKYMLIAGEPGSVVRGKKGGEDGVTVKKTMTALVIGIYSKGVTPADCNVIVENMGDYLAGQNI